MVLLSLSGCLSRGRWIESLRPLTATAELWGDPRHHHVAPSQQPCLGSNCGWPSCGPQQVGWQGRHGKAMLTSEVAMDAGLHAAAPGPV